MNDKEKSLEEIKHLLSLVLNSNLDVQTLVFSVSKHIVEFNELSILNDMPENVSKEVNEIARCYETTGEYKVYSPVGCADHTEMAASLAAILNRA